MIPERPELPATWAEYLTSIKAWLKRPYDWFVDGV